MSRKTSNDVATVGDAVVTPARGEVTVQSGGGFGRIFNVSPKVIWVITILILILIIVIASVAAVASAQPSTARDVTVAEDIVNLDNLYDLDTDGLCCRLVDSVVITNRYIYSPSTNRTYTFDPVSPQNACASVSGNELTECLNDTTGPDGQVRPIAHKGIELYYLATPGPAFNVCQSYVTCV